MSLLLRATHDHQVAILPILTHRSHAALAAILRDYDDALAYVCMHVG